MTREEQIEIAVTLGSITALVFGWRRLAGGIAVSNGLYNIGVHKPARKTVGTINLALGTAFLLWPDWPESARAALSGTGSIGSQPPAIPPGPSPSQLPAPQELTMPPTRYISLPSLDRNLDGNWTMLDVRDIRDAATTARAGSLKVGDVASLVLQQPGGAYLVFNAKVLGGSAMTMYNAQWMTQPPKGGPQAIDFSKEHVFAVH